MIVYLVGMPGSGKSTVGPELARRLDVPFLELDAEIERAAGKGVTEIFEQDGEPRFRELEAAALKDAAALDPSVISCGGGVVLEPANRVILRASGEVVFLSVPISSKLSTGLRMPLALSTVCRKRRRLCEVEETLDIRPQSVPPSLEIQIFEG